MKARKLALILAALLTLSACGQTPQSDRTTTKESTTEPAETGIPDLPDKNSGGFELHVGKPIQDKILWSNVSFAVGEENGEVLNDALYARNVKTAEKYGFRLSDTELPDPRRRRSSRAPPEAARTSSPPGRRS